MQFDTQLLWEVVVTGEISSNMRPPYKQVLLFLFRTQRSLISEYPSLFYFSTLLFKTLITQAATRPVLQQSSFDFYFKSINDDCFSGLVFS